MTTKETELKKQLGWLFIEAMKISTPLHHLEMTRQKLEERGLQSFDKQDILNELGKLQDYQRKINSQLLKIHDLLKQ